VGQHAGERVTDPRCTCSVWANEPRRDCPKHGVRPPTLRDVMSFIEENRFNYADPEKAEWARRWQCILLGEPYTTLTVSSAIEARPIDRKDDVAVEE